MDCENAMCIYQKEGKCILDEITLNEMGVCEECIVVTIDKGFLEYKKALKLEEIHQNGL